jgi:surfactin family lipopeptide synthetase A
LSAAVFLDRLRELQIYVRSDGDHLVLDAPKGALSAQLRDEIIARKGELITYLKAVNDNASVELPPLTAVPRNSAPLPLSYAQQRLWYLQQLEPDSTAYHLTLAARLDGPLDADALDAALQQLIARHEALRTCFVLADHQPAQLVAGQLNVPLVRYDVSHRPSDEQEAVVQQRVSELANTPFDLSQAPLLRSALITLGEYQHVVALVLHHTVADGWSLNRLQSELFTLYQGRTLAPLPLQYPDYALWQHAAFTDDALAPQLDYWHQQLQAPLPVLDLPTDHPRPAVQSQRGATWSFRIDLNAATRLEALAKAHGATPFMAWLAIYATLLMRYTGQRDLVIGTPIANRPHPDLEELIGCFANTLALRLQPPQQASFLDLLGQARETAVGALSHADVPFERLVKDLKLPRDLSRTPVFQTLFSYQDADYTLSLPDGLSAQPLALNNSVARTDLTLWLTRHEDGLTIAVEYPGALFEQTTIEQLCRHFQRLLKTALEQPEADLESLNLLTDAEEAILASWGNGEAHPAPECAIHQRIAAQARATPAACALRFNEQTLSYAELNCRANQLAHTLSQHGIGPGTVVGLCLPRHPDLVIALLAVMKTGAAYLPLDPDYPKARLAYCLHDANASALLTHAALAVQLPETPNTLCLDTLDTQLAPSDDPPAAYQPQAPAYVIYTSGSTGQPKGVVIPHAALAQFMAGIHTAIPLGPNDTLLAVTTPAFDIAALELYLPLIHGATVALADRETAQDGPALARALHNARATLMQATPATWRLLLSSDWQPPQGFRALAGGEALPPDLAAQLLNRGLELYNLYGPTEATIWVSCASITDASQPIPLGNPLPNTCLAVLDDHRQPCPIGIPGELYIGGNQLALGYLGKPELTQQRFIEHPTLGRLYQTGDRARYSSDGQLLFLGRNDQQIKLRGFRIELGDIENTLAKHPAVDTAVATLHALNPDDVRLVAYVVPSNPSAPPTPTELRHHLKSQLPAYMCPQHFVNLETLPLTPNGKLDRKALPSPFHAVTEQHAEPPQTDTERALAVIWQELLGVQPNRHDNFFDIGGHSLLGVRLIGLIKARLGIELSVRSILLDNLEQMALECESLDVVTDQGKATLWSRARRMVPSLLSK